MDVIRTTSTCIVIWIFASMLSVATAGGFEDESSGYDNESFEKRIGDRAISVMCDPNGAYLYCVPLSAEQCKDDISKIVMFCIESHSSLIPDLESEMDVDREKFRLLGEKVGNCIMQQHIATGDFDRAKAEECLNSE